MYLLLFCKRNYEKIFTLFAILSLLASCNPQNQNPETTISSQEKTQIQTTQKPGKIFTKTDQFVVQVIGMSETRYQALQIFRDKMVQKMNENLSDNERGNFYFFPRLRFAS